MITDEKKGSAVHNVIMENRNCFNERCINLYTQLGELVIKGRDLHINEVSVDTGDMTVEGDIWALIYGDKDKHGAVSLIGKLFR